MPTPKSKPSKFILSLPASLTGSQVVERAKARGMKTSRANVSRVRGLYGAKAVKTRATVTSPASKTEVATPKAAPAKTRSKADFTRAYPNLSPKEVVEKAKAAGVKFDVRYVYRIRAYDKVARKKKSVLAKVTTAKPTTSELVSATGAPFAATPAATSSSAEELLRAVAAELGLGRALEILAGERARVRAVLFAPMVSKTSPS